MLVLNNTLILGIWCSTVPHLPGCFCPWTFFQNIGFNMVSSDPCMSHLATQLGYSAGEFQALQLIVLATFGVVDYLPSACWTTFWKSIFKHQFGCRFDILDSISSFLCILTYAFIYVLIHHIIFRLYLYFLNILYFFKYSCTIIFHRRSLCTFYWRQNDYNPLFKQTVTRAHFF